MTAGNPNQEPLQDPFRKIFVDGIADTSSRVGDASTIKSHPTLLRMMVREIVIHAGMAQNAIGRLLRLPAQEEDIDFPIWENVQLLTTSVITAANYVSPVKKKYTARGEDIQRMLRLDAGQLPQMRAIRNTLTHMDERLQEHFDDDRPNLYARGVWETGEAQPDHILGWDCNSKQLYSLDHVVNAIELKGEIDFLADRSLQAMWYTRWVE